MSVRGDQGSRRGLRGAARAVALGALPPLAVLLVWELASRGSVTIPGVGETFDVLLHPLREPPDLDSDSLGMSVLVSMVRVLCGFALAVLLAVPLGILVGRWN